MTALKKPPSWEIPEKQVTPEDIFLNRRKFLQKTGKFGLGALAFYMLPNSLNLAQALGKRQKSSKLTPQLLREAITPEALVSHYNNFYEFSKDKENAWRLAKALPTDGWTIKVEGLVRKPKLLNIENIIRSIPVEERIYRLRCVETWSAIIPWRGFPMHKLIKTLDPLPSARFITFKTFLNPNIAPGQKSRFWEPWPYTEGLSMQEAMNELAFLATGMYGHPLHPQNGAPIRLVVPWKYGFKSIKSITAIEFTTEPPETFWKTISPLEYDFWANVEPSIPYARWHQKFERPLGKGNKIPTQPYNGYAKQVAGLYR